MKYNYSEHTNELITLAPALKNDIFDYSTSPYASFFERYFQFCLEHIKTIGVEIGVENTYFYFKNDNRINARAGKDGDVRYIYINSGAVLKLLFYSRELFNSDLLSSALKGVLDVPLDFFVFQFNSLFTFYHELGHIIQDPFEEFNNLGEQVTNKGYYELRHILEIDADQYATNRLFDHIEHKYKSFAKEHQTKELLLELINVSLSGIYVNLHEMFISRTPIMYYNEYSHPHSAIRLLLILIQLLNRIEVAFGFNKVQMKLEVERFIDSLESKNSITRGFNTLILENLTEIKKYAGQKLSKGETLIFLTQNRLKNLGIK